MRRYSRTEKSNRLALSWDRKRHLMPASCQRWIAWVTSGGETLSSVQIDSTSASGKFGVITGLVLAALFTVPLSFVTGLTGCIILLCLALFSINMASATAWMIVNTIVDSPRVASFGSIQNFGGYRKFETCVDRNV